MKLQKKAILIGLGVILIASATIAITLSGAAKKYAKSVVGYAGNIITPQSSGGGSQTFQQVTDLGSVTTNAIQFAGGTSTNGLFINGDVGLGGFSQTGSGRLNVVDFTTTTSNDRFGIENEFTYSPSASSTAIPAAMRIINKTTTTVSNLILAGTWGMNMLQINSTPNSTNAFIRGGDFTAENWAGTVPEVTGGMFSAEVLPVIDAVTTTNAAAGNFLVTISGTTTNAYGIKIPAFSGTGVGLANAYGLKIEDPGLGANQWGIYDTANQNYFGGSLQVVGTSTLATTTINGQDVCLLDGTNCPAGGAFPIADNAFGQIGITSPWSIGTLVGANTNYGIITTPTSSNVLVITNEANKSFDYFNTNIGAIPDPLLMITGGGQERNKMVSGVWDFGGGRSWTLTGSSGDDIDGGTTASSGIALALSGGSGGTLGGDGGSVSLLPGSATIGNAGNIILGLQNGGGGGKNGKIKTNNNLVPYERTDDSGNGGLAVYSPNAANDNEYVLFGTDNSGNAIISNNSATNVHRGLTLSNLDSLVMNKSNTTTLSNMVDFEETYLGAGNHSLQNLALALSPLTNGNTYSGLNVSLDASNITNPATTSAQIGGIGTLVQIGNGQNVTTFYGIGSDMDIMTSTVTGAQGSYDRMDARAGSNVNGFTGHDIQQTVEGIVNTSRGLYIEGLSGTGTVTTASGLIVESPLIGSTKWNSQFTGSAPSYFEGALSVGTTTSAVPSDSALLINGHTTYSGAAPAVSSCGVSPSIVGNDNVGTITVGTGVSVTACTMTFAINWVNDPVCTLSTNSVTALGDVSSVSTSTVSFELAASLASGKIYYHCAGQN